MSTCPLCEPCRCPNSDSCVHQVVYRSGQLCLLAIADSLHRCALTAVWDQEHVMRGRDGRSVCVCGPSVFCGCMTTTCLKPCISVLTHFCPALLFIFTWSCEGELFREDDGGNVNYWVAFDLVPSFDHEACFHLLKLKPALSLRSDFFKMTLQFES